MWLATIPRQLSARYAVPLAHPHDMASHRNDEGMSDSVALGVDGKLPWTAGWHGPQTSADACGDGSGLSEAEHGIATEIERLLSERGPLELNALLQLSPVTKAYLRDAPMRLAPLCQLFPERFVLEPTPSLQQLRLRLRRPDEPEPDAEAKVGLTVALAPAPAPAPALTLAIAPTRPRRRQLLPMRCAG